MDEKIVSMTKDTFPSVMAVSGGAIALTPVFWVNVAGLIIGATGLVIGFLQLRQRNLDRIQSEKNRLEKKRANDIKERELNLLENRDAII